MPALPAVAVLTALSLAGCATDMAGGGECHHSARLAVYSPVASCRIEVRTGKDEENVGGP